MIIIIMIMTIIIMMMMMEISKDSRWLYSCSKQVWVSATSYTHTHTLRHTSLHGTFMTLVVAAGWQVGSRGVTVDMFFTPKMTLLSFHGFSVHGRTFAALQRASIRWCMLSQFSTVYNAQGPLTTESPEAPSWHSNGLSAMVGTGCVLTGLLLLVNWGDPGWWRHGIVCSLPHSSPFSKRHPTQRGQQFQNFPAHFLPPPTKIASDHTKFSYSPVRESLYK